MNWSISRYLCLMILVAQVVACRRNMPDQDQSHVLARQRMVEMQLASPFGRQRIVDRRVLEVMGEVPRHKFVPPAMRAYAYDDRPLPIGYGQTISQPFIVALMTASLELRPEDRVLEIGTGSGYQAAVLSGLVEAVYSIEIVPELGEQAKALLAQEGYDNVHVRIGDGYQGWPEEAPFDAIIVTCAPESVPAPLVEQMRDGGRMVIPVGISDADQSLYLLEKRGGELYQEAILPVRFVPMTGSGSPPPFQD